jgi:hypothetical protein
MYVEDLDLTKWTKAVPDEEAWVGLMYECGWIGPERRQEVAWPAQSSLSMVDDPHQIDGIISRSKICCNDVLFSLRLPFLLIYNDPAGRSYQI